MSWLLVHSSHRQVPGEKKRRGSPQFPATFFVPPLPSHPWYLPFLLFSLYISTRSSHTLYKRSTSSSYPKLSCHPLPSPPLFISISSILPCAIGTARLSSTPHTCCSHQLSVLPATRHEMLVTCFSILVGLCRSTSERVMD